MKNKLYIQFYRDRKHDWRWRIRRCGRIIAESGEGYRRVCDAQYELKNILYAGVFGETKYPCGFRGKKLF